MRNANRKEITAELSLWPDISLALAASQTVQLTGFGKIDGIYFVSKVLHRISSGGEYEQGLSLYRIKGETRTEETPEEVSGGQERDYIVKRGDTLWDLAKAYYGSGTKYTIIYDANHEIIEEEAKKRGRQSSNGGYWIYPGTELTIP